jgi:DnaJ-class molecular chaperone
MDPYKELGLTSTASEAEVKKAYRKLATKHHPDKGGKEEDFKRIKEAYERITSPEKFTKENPFQSGHYSSDVNMDKIFSQFKNRGFNPGEFQFRQEPKVMFVAVSLKEAYDGCMKTVKFPNDEGLSDIPIPKGVRDKQVLMFARPGEFFPQRVEIKLLPHSSFVLDGIDLKMTITRPFIDFYTGCTIPVKTLSGSSFNLKLPKGSKSGTTLRLKDQGFINKQTVKGHLFLKVIADLPVLTESQIEEITKILH